ncbi:hypothetical protein [Streptomonospora wellingtoniae]|uniref:DUF4134 domain-containing protein n=1 Tax=Streptomonospora wellingtoniae TaxID=3075544 RepID=A0ABU2KZ25_9ACTN|nr:hypothetical protein [Streptomonospora sp. DSM 45055]MDT0304318.1 hypothetical protein [Streptomonospora sp. DSM 45055]
MTRTRTRPRRRGRRLRRLAVIGCTAAALLAVPAAQALAQGGGGQGTDELVNVIGRIREVIIALLAALATLLLTVGGLRWLLAGGDPGEVDKARRSLMGAALGYVIALLATVLLDVLEFIVGDAGGG